MGSAASRVHRGARGLRQRRQYITGAAAGGDAEDAHAAGLPRRDTLSSARLSRAIVTRMMILFSAGRRAVPACQRHSRRRHFDAAEVASTVSARRYRLWRTVRWRATGGGTSDAAGCRTGLPGPSVHRADQPPSRHLARCTIASPIIGPSRPAAGRCRVLAQANNHRGVPAR